MTFLAQGTDGTAKKHDGTHILEAKLILTRGHCKRYRATGPHRAGVDVDVTPPTGGLVRHTPNPATLCDRSSQGSKL